MELPKVPQLTNHAPVSVTLVASAITSVVIAFLKARYQVDLAAQEANITIIVGAIAGYLTGRAQA